MRVRTSSRSGADTLKPCGGRGAGLPKYSADEMLLLPWNRDRLPSRSHRDSCTTHTHTNITQV